QETGARSLSPDAPRASNFHQSSHRSVDTVRDSWGCTSTAPARYYDRSQSQQRSLQRCGCNSLRSQTGQKRTPHRYILEEGSLRARDLVVFDVGATLVNYRIQRGDVWGE